MYHKNDCKTTLLKMFRFGGDSAPEKQFLLYAIGTSLKNRQQIDAIGNKLC